MITDVAMADRRGCPSGLEPPGDRSIVDPSPFVQRKDGVSRIDLAVFGAKCASCIAKIEGGLKDLPGVEAARLNLSTGRLSVDWRGSLKARAIVERLQALGYRAAAFDPQAGIRRNDEESRRLLRCLAVAGFAAANVMLLSVSIWAGQGEMGEGTRTLLHWISALIAIPAALYSGRPFFGSALRALKAGQANMDVPISLGVSLALALSIFETIQGGEHAYFDAAVMLLFFLLIGRYLDHRLRARAKSAAEDLIALQATTASRMLDDGTIECIAARDIRTGDRLLLSPGDRAPVDGSVIEGRSNIDVSLVTGESAPAKASVGDSLHAGMLNLSSRLIIVATKTTNDSLLAELTRLIEAGEQSKSRYVRLADRAAKLYVPVVHSLALATFAAWYFFVDAGLHTSVMNAVAVLIITCPCALGLAAPAVQIVATARLFRAGVLVKSGDALERLAEVRAVLFDKTGTLTFGKVQIANEGEITFDNLRSAAQLARASRHPLSRAIVEAAGAGPVADGGLDVSGCGVEGVIDGVAARLGRADWVGVESQDTGETEAWFRRGDEPATRFLFADQLRPDAAETVAALNEQGLTVAMLSGDQKRPAAQIAAALGGIEWRAPLTPLQKIDYVRQLENTGVKTVMIGDGLNDAPSLAAAHASLSPGTAADASQAAADFIYQGDRLAPIVETINTARKARARMRENFAFAAFYNFCAVPLAALGLVTPLIAALAMSGSSIIVILNALRLAGRPQAGGAS